MGRDLFVAVVTVSWLPYLRSVFSLVCLTFGYLHVLSVARTDIPLGGHDCIPHGYG